MENVNSHPLKVVTVEDEGIKANSHPYQVEVIAGDNIATEDWVDERIRGLWVEVDELPETGEEGVTYYLAKEGEVDTFDLYRWVNNGWIKIDTDVKLYSSTGENTDGPMTQKATTDATKFATGEAVSGLKIYSGLGGNTDGLVLQKYVPDRLSVSNRSTTSGGAEYRSIIAKMRNGSTDVGDYFNILYTDMRKGLNVGAVGAYGVELEALPFTGATSSADGVQGMVPKPLTGDEDKFLKGDGTWGTVAAGPTVVQITGTSTTDVMSQDAATKMIYPDFANYPTAIRIGNTYSASARGIGIGYANTGSVYRVPSDGIAIGVNVYGEGGNAIAIGKDVRTRYNHQIAIGNSAEITTNVVGAIALGAGARASRQGELNIGCSASAYIHSGYNDTSYRVIGGVHDGVEDHDVVTVGQMNTAIASAGATVLTNTQFNNLWENA